MSNNLEIESILQKIRELELHLNDEDVFLEVWNDGSGSVRQDRYGEYRELLLFHDLDDFLVKADNLMGKKSSIQVDPSNIIYENEHFMIISKEVE